VILSLQNISMETQGGQQCSRLAVLRRERCRDPKGPRSPRQSHWAYGPTVNVPVFAAPPFTFTFTSLAAFALDTGVNAKQEGSP
jgi:hypothetical protein